MDSTSASHRKSYWEWSFLNNLPALCPGGGNRGGPLEMKSRQLPEKEWRRRAKPGAVPSVGVWLNTSIGGEPSRGCAGSGLSTSSTHRRTVKSRRCTHG